MEKKSMGLRQTLEGRDCVWERLWIQRGGPSPGHRPWGWDKEQGVLPVAALPPLAGCRAERGEA